MKGRSDHSDAVLNATEVPAEKRLLYAMLSDQIQTLGLCLKMGMWRRDPEEIGDWLRAEYARGRHARRCTYFAEMALMEMQLWGRGTDVLIEVMERETIVRIDRGRILELARECADGTWSKGTARTHAGYGAPKH
jgi:hypothetical protein